MSRCPSPLPTGTGDYECILVGLLLYFLHADICRFAITWGEFGEGKMAVEGFCADCIHGGGVSFTQKFDGLCLCCSCLSNVC